MKRIKLMLFLMLAMAFTLTNCEGCEEKTTGEKVEERIEEAGESVEDAADEVGDEIEDATDG